MGVKIRSDINQIYQEWERTLLDPNTGDMPPPIWQRFATPYKSNGRSTLHSWFLDQAMPTRWNGKRQHNNLSSWSFEIFNDEEYELSYEFEEKEVDDDPTGVVREAVMRAKQSRLKWEHHKNLLAAQALEAGTSATAWDGQNLFDNAHPYDPDGIGTASTYDNLLTLALNHANLETALAVLADMKDAAGMPIMDSGPIALIHPVALRRTVKDVLTEGMISTTAARGLFAAAQMSPNEYTMPVVPVENKYLTDATAWYLARPSGLANLLIFQERSPLELDEEGGPGSAIHYNERKFRFGGTVRYKFAPGLPQCGLRSKP